MIEWIEILLFLFLSFALRFAVAITAAAITGGAMAAGGIAAAVRANKMKTKPRGVQYGGSQDALNGYRETYATGADAGASQAAKGVAGIDGTVGDVQGQRGVGSSLIAGADGLLTRNSAIANDRTAMNELNAYKPGAIAAAQTQQVLDQNARNTLGAARSGGALGLRNAIGANAQAGVDAAQGLAVQRAQEEQALLAAKVAQSNSDRGVALDAAQLGESNRLQQLGLGANVVQGSNSQILGAQQNVAALGQNREQSYLDSLKSVENAQLQADLDYEQRRQADQQRRSQNMWNLGSSLIGSGGKMLGGIGGGGGGAGGGG